jgi:hypothetical protein
VPYLFDTKTSINSLNPSFEQQVSESKNNCEPTDEYNIPCFFGPKTSKTLNPSLEKQSFESDCKSKDGLNNSDVRKICNDVRSHTSSTSFVSDQHNFEEIVQYDYFKSECQQSAPTASQTPTQADNQLKLLIQNVALVSDGEKIDSEIMHDKELDDFLIYFSKMPDLIDMVTTDLNKCVNPCADSQAGPQMTTLSQSRKVFRSDDKKIDSKIMQDKDLDDFQIDFSEMPDLLEMVTTDFTKDLYPK